MKASYVTPKKNVQKRKFPLLTINNKSFCLQNGVSKVICAISGTEYHEPSEGEKGLVIV